MAVSTVERIHDFISKFDRSSLPPASDVLKKAEEDLKHTPLPETVELEIEPVQIDTSLFRGAKLLTIIPPPYLFASYETRMRLIGFDDYEEEIDEQKKYLGLQPGLLMSRLMSTTGAVSSKVTSPDKVVGRFELAGPSLSTNIYLSFIGALREIRTREYRHVSSIIVSSEFFPLEENGRDHISSHFPNYLDVVGTLKPVIEQFVGEKYGIRQPLPTSSA